MEKQEFYFQWHINNNCNLRCKHCYQDDYGFNSLDFGSLLYVKNEISKTLSKWNMLGRISLTGGEPFLNPYLFPLLDELEKDENVVEIGILTNGTIISTDIVESLKKYSKLREVQISLDGATKATHEKTRGPNTFDKSVEAIKMLRAAKINVAVMFTLTKVNMHEAVDMISFSESIGVNALTIERVTPCGHTNKSDILTKEELKSVYCKITEISNTLKSNLRIRRSRSLWVLTQEYCKDDKVVLGGFCPVGFTALTIMPDATVLPCRRLNVPIGNLLKEGLFSIWYGSELLWKIRDKNNLKGKCHNCKNIAMCGGCRAVAYELTGDCMGEDVQCWM